MEEKFSGNLSKVLYCAAAFTPWVKHVLLKVNWMVDCGETFMLRIICLTCRLAHLGYFHASMYLFFAPLVCIIR